VIQNIVNSESRDEQAEIVQTGQTIIGLQKSQKIGIQTLSSHLDSFQNVDAKIGHQRYRYKIQEISSKKMKKKKKNSRYA
jgi:arginine repressor